MADTFSNPGDQAQLDQLLARLQTLDAEVKAMSEQMAREFAAVRAERRSGQYAARAEGAAGTRSTASAAPILEQEVKAIDQQVVSYTKLNELIAQRIELEKAAATAAKETAIASGAAAGGAGASGAAGAAGGEAEAIATLQRLKAQGGLGFQTAGSLQRVLNALGAGGAAAGAAGLAGGQERAAASARFLALSEEEVTARVTQAAAAMTEFDLTLGRTGALSGAALGALANGTITLSQLGHQVTETIGKFGGWTLAAAAVYGVVGSLNEVRHGAVDVSSTLTGLTKFLPNLDTERARQQIVHEGQSTATPLGDVGDAAQQFAKVFKNQTDVFTATHVALTAAKLDNIDLADSYKYLTAIVQETGVGAQALPGIFDQVTAAQDKLGARVSQLLPAYSRSIGAVQTARGDPNELLALEALALIRSGQSGNVIGTGFARGATNFFPTADSRGVLERHGINPDQGYTKAIIEAIDKGPGFSPDARREVSIALFGKLRGSLLAPLFRAPPEQLQHFLQETSPGASKGLAEKQLGTTVGQTSNQLELLKINLQAIGGELTGSKITTPFGIALHLINDMLEATTRLMAVWDSLPGPVKEVASTLALAAGTLALMRRFNVGASFAASSSPLLQGVAPIFSRSPQKVLETQVNSYMKGLTGVLEGNLAQSSVRLTQAQLRVAQADQEYGALVADGGASEEALTEARLRYQVALNTAAAAEGDVAFYRSQLAPGALAGYRSQLEGEAALAGGAGARGAAPSAAEAEQGRLTTATAAATGAMSQLAGYAIPAAIAAFFAFASVKTSVQATNDDRTSALRRLQAARTPQEARKAYDDYTSAAELNIPLLGNVDISGIWDFQGSPGEKHALTNQLGYIKARANERRVAQEALNRAGELEAQGRYGDAYRRVKTDNAFRDLGSLTEPTPFGGQYKLRYQDALNRSRFQYEGAAVGGKTNPFAIWEQAETDLKNRLEPMLQSYSNAAKVFGTKSGDLQQLTAGFAFAVAKLGKNRSDTQAMQILAQAQSDLVSGVDKQVTDLLNLAQMSTTNRGQQGYLNQALGAVTGAQAKIRSLFGAAERLPGADTAGLRQAEGQILGLIAQKRQAVIQQLLSLVKSEGDLAVSKIGGIGPEADLRRAEAQLTSLQNQLSTARSSGADAQTVNSLQAQVNQALVTVLQDRVNYLQQLAQATIQYQQSGTADPVAQQQIAINQLSALYAKLQAAGADPLTLLQVAGQKRAAVLQQVSDQIGQEQAGVQLWLAQSNIGQPQQVQLRNAVTAAQRELSYLQSLPSSQVSPQALVQAQTNLAQARGALVQYQIQQGQQLIQAETALAQGGTFDPVQIAQEALDGARRLLAYDIAHHAAAATITSDRAGVAAGLKGKLEAEWQKRQSTIEFLASTYQITGAQEIQRLQKLYQTMKKSGASYQALQQIAQQIWNLRYGNTGELNLNTGDIHLPSTYEIKSALLRGRDANRRATAAGLVADVKTDVNMKIYVSRDADVRKVAKALKDALGVSVNGLARAAGAF
jgi:hypothetical protein